MTTEIIEAPKTAVAAQPVQQANPAFLVQMAVQQGADLDKLERLMAMQERWEANEARRAFVVAMSDFKSEPMEIYKRKQVQFKTQKGETSYMHAELSDVVDVVVPTMAKHGLSHRWDVRREQGRIYVKCIVTHRLGHSESIELDGAPDDSGTKNNIQQMASTVTYLQRYSLLAIVGLATKSIGDDDGAGGKGDTADPVEAYAGPLANKLRELVAEVRETLTDAAARDFYMANRAHLQADKQAYALFKDATAAYRTALAAKGGAA